VKENGRDVPAFGRIDVERSPHWGTTVPRADSAVLEAFVYSGSGAQSPLEARPSHPTRGVIADDLVAHSGINAGSA